MIELYIVLWYFTTINLGLSFVMNLFGSNFIILDKKTVHLTFLFSTI